MVMVARWQQRVMVELLCTPTNKPKNQLVVTKGHGGVHTMARRVVELRRVANDGGLGG